MGKVINIFAGDATVVDNTSELPPFINATELLTKAFEPIKVRQVEQRGEMKWFVDVRLVADKSVHTVTFSKSRSRDSKLTLMQSELEKGNSIVPLKLAKAELPNGRFTYAFTAA